MNMNAQIKFIGDLLIKKGLLTKAQKKKLEVELTENTASDSKSFEDHLIQKEIISEEALLHVYSDHLGRRFIDLSQHPIDPQSISLVPIKFAMQHTVIPVKLEDNVLTVALRDPFDISIIDQLKTFTQCDINVVISKSEDIQSAIKFHYGTGAETVDRLVQDRDDESPTTAELVEKEFDENEITNEASMVKYVNQLLMDGHKERATDIHIEPFRDKLQIRYRIDGVLHEAKTPKEIQKLHLAIISRLKVMANLNISEKRKPQDGRCKLTINDQEIDLRLSTYPTLYGEGMSIRLLNRSSTLIDLKEVGLQDDHYKQITELLKKPNGIILVTGPTGCGKTTTLYSCINYITDTKIRIVTLEDPIEYQMDGVNQIQTDAKIGLTFASGFRSILRQDPDVILVGEIRDSETAQIAIRSALTGHLVLSTLHTNNALASVARLLDLGIEPFLLTSTLKAVVAQRLVRRICPACKKKYTPNKDQLAMFKFVEKRLRETATFYHGKGCDQCHHTGYFGRIALVEMLTLDDELNELIAKGNSKVELRKQAEETGMKTLREDGFQKVIQGLTTLDEVVRVIE